MCVIFVSCSACMSNNGISVGHESGRVYIDFMLFRSAHVVWDPRQAPTGCNASQARAPLAAAAAVEPIAAPRQPAVVLGGSPPPRGAVSMARVAPLPPRRRTRFAPTPDPLQARGGPGATTGTAMVQGSPDSQVSIVASPQGEQS